MMGSKGAVTLLGIVVTIIAFVGVAFGFLGLYGEMAHKHSVYNQDAQNLSAQMERVKQETYDLGREQHNRTRSLEANPEGGNVFVNALTGSVAAAKNFLNLIGLLFVVAPAMASLLHMPTWVGSLLTTLTVFIITYLVLVFLAGRDRV